MVASYKMTGLIFYITMTCNGILSIMQKYFRDHNTKCIKYLIRDFSGQVSLVYKVISV